MNESEWQELYVSHARKFRADVIPFPGDEVQVITNSQSGETTAKGAISIWETILDGVREIAEPSRDWKVLDYGCGWGRMTRLLPFYFDRENIHGVDVDETLIGDANRLVPFLDHRQIRSMEPLPFDDDHFDLVFANSVFSHLSAESAAFALGELSRVSRPGAVVVVSVLEEAELRRYYSNDTQKAWIERILGAEESATAELSEKGFVWGDTGRWDNYGISVVTDDWIRRSFESVGMEFRATRRGRHAGTQNYKFGVRTRTGASS